VNAYPTCLGIAVFLGWFLWTRTALARGWIRSPLSPVAPVAALLGIVGAKLLAALGEWSAYGQSLLHWRGPLAVQGGMLATGACLALWARFARVPVLAVLDALARAFAVILVPIRLGCLSAGCCYGAPTDGLLGMVGRDGCLRHPTQVYEIGLALLLIALLNGLSSVRAAAGRASFVFALVYGVGRAAIESVREDTRPVFASITYPQIVAAAMALIGAAGLLRARGRAAQVVPSEAPALRAARAAPVHVPHPRSRRDVLRLNGSAPSRFSTQPSRSNRAEPR
jgi:phosphatidylglycerol:prolipoprotein diacylglycerol transferase